MSVNHHPSSVLYLIPLFYWPLSWHLTLQLWQSTGWHVWCSQSFQHQKKI